MADAAVRCPSALALLFAAGSLRYFAGEVWVQKRELRHAAAGRRTESSSTSGRKAGSGALPCPITWPAHVALPQGPSLHGTALETGEKTGRFFPKAFSNISQRRSEQQGSPAAHRIGEQAVAMRARQPQGKDGHSPLRLLPPRFRFGMVSHPMGHGSTLSPVGPAAGRAFQRGHPQPCFTMAKRDPRGWTGNVRPGSMHQLPKAQAQQDVCQEASSAHLGPSLRRDLLALVSCVSLPNPRCQQELGWQKHFEW